MAFTFQLLLIGLLFGSCSKNESEPWDTTFPPEDKIVQYDVPFNNVPDISDITMYEVNLRAFSESGDLKGVEQGLDHIKDLGINVVWLMPIYPTAIEKSVGSPYSVRDYLDIHEDFGTLEDLRSLVKEAHKRDMAVILDWVANHTSWDNEWTNNKNWYTQNASGEIISPPEQNWADVADLNYGNQSMRQEMIKALKYWVLTANVDGYRCDYASGVPDDFWKQAIDTLRAIPNRELIMYAESDVKSISNAGFDLIFGWPYFNSLADLYSNTISTSKFFSDNTGEYDGLADGSEIVRWITNHDYNAWEEIPQHYFGDSDKGAMSAFVLTTCMGGVPLVYTGQEVAYPSNLGFFERQTATVDFTDNADYLNEYKVLLNYYANSEVLKEKSLDNFSSDNVIAFKKSIGSKEVLVIVNVRDSNEDYSIPSSLQGTTWNNVFDTSNTTFNNTLSLDPFEYIILENN